MRKYLIPDSNDEIRQEQMREMELLNVNTGAPNTSPNSSILNNLPVSNSDGQDDIASDETGSTHSSPHVSFFIIFFCAFCNASVFHSIHVFAIENKFRNTFLKMFILSNLYKCSNQNFLNRHGPRN